jgi:hypothetical protein
VLRALSGCRGLAINWLIVGIVGLRYLRSRDKRENGIVRAAPLHLSRTSPSSASFRVCRPGIRAREYPLPSFARFPTRKTKSRHPPKCGRALFRSDSHTAVKHRGRSLLKSDRCCQRQRLSFIRRGDAPAKLREKRNTLKGLAGRPFRASKAHRLPKSVGYVSAGPR